MIYCGFQQYIDDFTLNKPDVICCWLGTFLFSSYFKIVCVDFVSSGSEGQKGWCFVETIWDRRLWPVVGSFWCRPAVIFSPDLAGLVGALKV